MKLESYSDPRPWYLQRARFPDRPLIVAGGGFTNRCEPPGTTHWLDWITWEDKQLNANFLEQSRLLDLAQRRDVNVCFINSSKFGRGPWWSRNWTQLDVVDIYAIREKCIRWCQPSDVWWWGFSNAGTLAHRMAQDDLRWDAVVSHSGFFPKDLTPGELRKHNVPVLLVVGLEEQHASLITHAKAARDAYRAAGRRMTIHRPNCRHRWHWESNDFFYDWSVGA